MHSERTLYAPLSGSPCAYYRVEVRCRHRWGIEYLAGIASDADLYAWIGEALIQVGLVELRFPPTYERVFEGGEVEEVVAALGLGRRRDPCAEGELVCSEWTLSQGGDIG